MILYYPSASSSNSFTSVYDYERMTKKQGENKEKNKQDDKNMAEDDDINDCIDDDGDDDGGDDDEDEHYWRAGVCEIDLAPDYFFEQEDNEVYGGIEYPVNVIADKILSYRFVNKNVAFVMYNVYRQKQIDVGSLHGLDRAMYGHLSGDPNVSQITLTGIRLCRDWTFYKPKKSKVSIHLPNEVFKQYKNLKNVIIAAKTSNTRRNCEFSHRTRLGSMLVYGGIVYCTI